MAKRIIATIAVSFMMLSELSAQQQIDIYERNCMQCHKQMSLTMQKIFMRYLLKYSSEVSVKSAMFDFLKNPNYFTSALRKDQIARYGLKNPTTLSDDDLQKAIELYWEKYKVFGKLK